ncbi:EF-P 5-aminopentanol modification-associated protein YfmF [Streptococcus marimammalium]|uniref:EF-P 5-aminopentanol modification-associated protein YfmF n=1 Tax=Streptococcus marimammalium TaxID=269666 RepID=UPI0004780B57|nr:insulinase family protein [Streptococcus marimammalium]
MKITDGVTLHIIKTNQFKTNHLTFRFSSQLNKKNMASRFLVSKMIETANSNFPNTTKIREKLADLYGATLSTSVLTKGLIHIVDIDITFLPDCYLLSKDSILEEIIQFLSQLLFEPLISLEQYELKTFEVVKQNAIRQLEFDLEDPFYYSELALDTLFFEREELKLPYTGSKEMLEKENAYTSYQEFKRMLTGDSIDIFLLGSFDDAKVIDLFTQFPFKSRHNEASFYHDQKISNITNKKIEEKSTNQSILQIGYSFSKLKNLKDYSSLLLLNSMLGAFSHSNLFTEIRQKEGLTYSIGSEIDPFLGALYIFAAIDSHQRNKVMTLINRQLNLIKLGRFSTAFLNQTKEFLITQRKIIRDNPKMLIEERYNQILPVTYQNMSTFIDSINSIRKRDVLEISSTIKLKSVYFMRGTLP